MDGFASERITTQEMIEALTMTLANARTEGEPYQSKAEVHLGPIEAILLHIGIERRNGDEALQHEQTKLEHLDQKAETIVDKRANEIWELIGCPDYDPIYSILFPSAAQDGATIQSKAERLSVVADLLSNAMHPKIESAHATLVAQEFRSLYNAYQDHFAEISKRQLRKKSLDDFEASVACIGLLALGTLRRTLRTMGVEDLDIQTVVPPPVSSRRIAPRS